MDQQHVDVVIVGAGATGLPAATRLSEARLSPAAPAAPASTEGARA